MEKERRQRALDKKKPESPKSKKIDLSQPDFLSSLDRNYPMRNSSSIADLSKSSLPVQGLPPGILIGNYTDKVMNNIQAVFKVIDSKHKCSTNLFNSWPLRVSFFGITLTLNRVRSKTAKFTAKFITH